MAAEPSLEEKTDQELVQLTLQNQDNFLYLVNRYQQKLLFFIKRISNVPDEEAQDMLQEVFIKTYKNLNGFDQSLKFSSWIYRITRNHVISHHRKYKNKEILLSSEIADNLINSLISDFDITKKVDQNILRQNITTALTQIGDKYREVIILKYFEEKSYEEISDIIKKPMGTVATYLNRAKKKLRDNFKKAYGQ